MTQESVLKVLRKKKKEMTAAEIAKALKIMSMPVRRSLNSLLKQKIVFYADKKGLGGNKIRYWKIVKHYAPPSKSLDSSGNKRFGGDYSKTERNGKVRR